MKQYWIALFFVAGISSGWSADGIRLIGEGKAPQQTFTGNMRVDFFGQTELALSPQVQEEIGGGGPARKSPFLAAGLSLLVPGAGEFYTGHYWEAAAFLAADVAAWALAYSYDKRGDRQTDYFQDYANKNWSVVRYGQYAQDNLVPLISDPNSRNFNWLIPGTEGLPPWQRVNWAQLNEMERAIGSLTGNEGRYYSHTLPSYGEQQYYELIGKYQQFNQGWNGAPPTYHYGDPVAPNFSFYSGERGKANSFYNTASTWVTVAIINHVVSAAYAALGAGWYNKAHASLGLQQIPVGIGYVRVPVVKLSYDL